MTRRSTSRRRFLQSTSAACAAVMASPYVFTADAEDRTRPRSKNDRFGIGAIGMRYQGSVITEKALVEGDVVAIADVDRQVAEKAREQFGGKADAVRRLSQAARTPGRRRRDDRHARSLAHGRW